MWTDKYAPLCINDCVLPKRIKNYFSNIVSINDQKNTELNLQNLILFGKNGVGKTSLAVALALELDAEYYLINGSNARQLDYLRGAVTNFLSTRPMKTYSTDMKIVIYDEACGLPETTQNALKGFIDEFKHNCRFIFTANDYSKIIDGIKSRAMSYDFTLLEGETEEHRLEYINTVKRILIAERVPFKEESLPKIIDTNGYPDLRQCLNLLQAQTQGGEISNETAIAVPKINFTKLVKVLKSNVHADMRAWVKNNGNYYNNVSVISYLYDNCDTLFKPESIPALIRLSSSYLELLSRSSVPNITITAFLGEIMLHCKLKDI